MKLKIEKEGNDGLAIKHKEEIQITFHKSIDLLLSNIIKIIIVIITPWLMEPGGSMQHSQGFSNNPYPESNEPNSSY